MGYLTKAIVAFSFVRLRRARFLKQTSTHAAYSMGFGTPEVDVIEKCVVFSLLLTETQPIVFRAVVSECLRSDQL